MAGFPDKTPQKGKISNSKWIGSKGGLLGKKRDASKANRVAAILGLWFCLKPLHESGFYTFASRR
jgi:hypothetical protein